MEKVEEKNKDSLLYSQLPHWVNRLQGECENMMSHRRIPAVLGWENEKKKGECLFAKLVIF